MSDGPLRVGLLVPSSNTVMESDFWRHLPRDSQLHTARMLLKATTPEAESAMLDHHVMPAVRDLATARPHVVVFGCTSAGALRGNESDAQLCKEISELTQVDTISVIASVRETIASRRAQRIGIITPYVDALNARIRSSLEADGLHVEGIHGLDISDNFAIGLVPPERIVEFAVTSFSAAEIDLLFVSCTNFRAIDVIEAIEQAMGVPVVTSNQATLRALHGRLRLLGKEVPVDSSGHEVP